jgi:hypothetical protein
MTGDPVAASLTAWVFKYMETADSADLLALGTGDMPMAVAVHHALDIHEYRAACHALESDRSIAPLLSTPDRQTPILYAPWTRVFLWANQLPMGMLAAAALEAALDGVALSAEAIVSRSLQNLAATRAICNRQRYSATVATAISGVTLPQDLELTTPLGRVTSMNPDLGILLVGQQSSTAMVVSKTRIHIAIHPPAHIAGRVDRGTNDALSWLSTRICAAFLLAVAPDKDMRPLVTSQTVVAPFSPWTSSLSPYHEDRGEVDVTLDDAEAADLSQLCTALAGTSASNIRIALERTLAAATERNDASDVLIDSVIAWENLLGTTQETTFRVTAALAWLLARDSYEERAKLSRELKRLYGQRSKVVHGAKVAQEDVNRDAGRALQISRDALRRILLDELWLCERKDSAIRNTAILLGDPRLLSDG